MHDEKQAGEPPADGLDPLDRLEIERSEAEGFLPHPEPGTAPAPLAPGTATTASAPSPPLAHPRGLLWWLIAISLLGVGGLLAGEQEMAALVAFAGIVMAAQAADLDARWTSLYWLLAWVVPVGGSLAFASTAWLVLESDLSGTARAALLSYSVGASALSLLTMARPVANRLVRLMFRGATPSHSLRLAARAVLFGILFVVPGYFVFPRILELVSGDSGGILENVSMTGELVGYVIVALASVGFLVRRDLRQTLERLGIRPLTRNHLGMVAAGLGALVLFNSSAEWIQHRVLPDLWRQDHDINERLAQGLGVGKTLMLGLSAGVGEEITLRGALQPRLGLGLTSLLFAALHVQYSWFGMLAILALGLILGTIRNRTSTTTSILVHALYDVLAVFTT